MTLDTATLREQFPMYADRAPGFAYLDSGASSLTPVPVLEAMNGFYSRYRANVHRGMYAASMEATDRYEGARQKVAEFINARPEEVVFTRGATESLNAAAYSLCGELGQGDEVVISVMEHHANFVPWQQLAERQGFTLRFAPLADGSGLDMDALRALVNDRTRIVSLTAASNVLGALVPVREVADLAHAVGAAFILDAAQLAGHGDLDVAAMDCDLMAFSGHKMYGPTGIGVLYGKKAVLDAMRPFMYGGDMIVEVTKDRAVWNEVPHKFEAGTPNIAGAIGLGAAVDWLRDVGVPAIREHELRLVRSCIERVSEIPGITVYGPPAGTPRGSVVSMTMHDVHPHDLTDIIGRQGVCVRGGHHCAMPLMLELGLMGGTTRASFGAYNDDDDVDLLIRALGRASEVFSRR